MRVADIAKLLDQRSHTTWARRGAETLAGCWVIALLTFAGYVLHFNPAPVGFLFLLVVVSVAILSGFWQASVVSLLACACLDYFFYPPVLHFSIADPADWVALGSFEVSALIVSRLSSRERLNSREALAPVFADLNKYEATTHFVGQSTIFTLTNERASGEAYCLAHHLTVDGEKRRLMVASLRYLDTFVKKDGAWLFAERLLYVDWLDERALS